MTVLLAVPTRGQVLAQTIEPTRLLAERLVTTPRYFTGHLSAGLVRREIVEWFLAERADVLVMVDDDVVPGARAHEIVSHLGRFDVVAAAVPMSKPDVWPRPVIAAFRDHPKSGLLPAYPAHQGERVVECDAVGTGCVAITRGAVAECGAAFAETFHPGGRFESDDAAFCRAARESGYRIGCDFRATCDHLTVGSLAAVMLEASGVSRAA